MSGPFAVLALRLVVAMLLIAACGGVLFALQGSRVARGTSRIASSVALAAPAPDLLAGWRSQRHRDVDNGR